MTLEDALAICLFLQNAETIEEHHERALGVAHEIVAREAWSALLRAHGPNFPSRPSAASPFGLATGGAASFQFGVPIPVNVTNVSAGFITGPSGERLAVPTAESFFGGDVNIAELDTRTFFSPAHPDAVSRLPRVVGGARAGDEDTGCPVCLADMEAPEGATLREMPCGHRFHESCLLEWLRTKNTCPVCRVALPAAPSE